MLAYLRGSGSTAAPAASAKGKGKAKAGAKKKANTNKALPGTPPILERKRPGTSGTELNLRTTRIEATTAFLAAQKAEREYRARRQAKIARDDVEVAKVHLGAAGQQFRAGVTALTAAFKLMPAVMREKNTKMKEKREKERKEREEKMAKLKAEKKAKFEEEKKKREEEEAAAAAEAEAEDDDAEGEAEEEAEAGPSTAVV